MTEPSDNNPEYASDKLPEHEASLKGEALEAWERDTYLKPHASLLSSQAQGVATAMAKSYNGGGFTAMCGKEKTPYDMIKSIAADARSAVRAELDGTPGENNGSRGR